MAKDINKDIINYPKFRPTETNAIISQDIQVNFMETTYKCLLGSDKVASLITKNDILEKIKKGEIVRTDQIHYQNKWHYISNLSIFKEMFTGDSTSHISIKKIDEISKGINNIDENIKDLPDKLSNIITRNWWLSPIISFIGLIIGIPILMLSIKHYSIQNILEKDLVLLQNKIENDLNGDLKFVKTQLSKDSKLFKAINDGLSNIEGKIITNASAAPSPKPKDEVDIKTIIDGSFKTHLDNVIKKGEIKSIEGSINSINAEIKRLENKNPSDFDKKIEDDLKKILSKLEAPAVTPVTPVGNSQDNHAVLVWISISSKGINPTKEFVDKLMKTLTGDGKGVDTFAKIPKEVWLVSGPKIEAIPKQFSKSGLDIPNYNQLNADKNSEDVGQPSRDWFERSEQAFKTDKAINKKRKLIIMASDEATAPKVLSEQENNPWKSFDAIDVILVHGRTPYEGSLDQRREINKWNVWAANQTNAKVRILFSSLKPNDKMYQAFQPGDKLLNSFFEILKESMLY